MSEEIDKMVAEKRRDIREKMEKEDSLDTLVDEAATAYLAGIEGKRDISHYLDLGSAKSRLQFWLSNNGRDQNEASNLIRKRVAEKIKEG